MENSLFTIFANRYIDRLRSEGRHSTAHVYKNALRSFTIFCDTPVVSFGQVTRESLRLYNNYLTACRLKLNSISTYMRMLRCIYNQGVDAGVAPFIPRLFRDVFTGVDTRHKKAIPVTDLHKLLYADPKSEKLRRTQAIANLMFQFCGMPFADLVHLEKSNLQQGVLTYNRIKTGTPMIVEIMDASAKIIRRLRSKHAAAHAVDCPDYLFGILSGQHKRNEQQGYTEYQSALRRFNNQLRSLSRKLFLRYSVTSYTLRHSWATTAKYRGVPIEMISESLGHQSIRTTQIYLKSFELTERTKVNKQNYSYVKNIRFSDCLT